MTASELGEGGAAFLTRGTGFGSLAELGQTLETRYDDVAEAISGLIGTNEETAP